MCISITGYSIKITAHLICLEGRLLQCRRQEPGFGRARPKMTLSGLLGRTTVAVPVSIKLLSDMDKAQENQAHVSQHSLRLDGWNYDYANRSSKIADGLVLHTQTIALGDGDRLEVYHTPGHSPDSISMRVGSLLFLGDLFFAPNPGMAGAYGWSQQDLMQSILKILWILENEDIDLCFSGMAGPSTCRRRRRR